jgi:membrane-bound metal-dependent hydrolase YbcI (DUF457 family)
MFIGHFAVAFGAKKYVQGVSLGILFLACQLADIIWSNLVLLGIEKVEIEPGITVMTPLNFLHYPWSHSLATLLLWSLLFAIIYALLRRAGPRAALVIAVVVLSHWLLDFIVHRPDMPLTPTGQMRLGASLWNLPLAAVALELLLFTLGVGLYLRHTRAVNRRGNIALWALLLFLLTAYTLNLIGPPPPSVTVLAWSAQSYWLIIAWGFWIDRNRVAC